MAAQGTVLANAVVRLSADTRRFASDLKRAQASLSGAGAAASRTTKMVSTLGKVAALAAGGFLIFAGARGVSAAVNSLLDFDHAMTQSLAIMGNVSETMQADMVRAAKAAGEEFNFAAEQGAEAFFFLASAGLDAEQSIAALPQVAAFARAGMFDLATATDLATDAQSALGLTVDDAQENLENLTRVTDTLVAANTLANASVEQFSTALTTEAGAAMKTFGIDVEEGVAVLAAFADQGIKSQRAGSGFSRILRLMSQAAVKNKAEMEELGIEFFDAQGNLRNMADIVQSLEMALGGMSDETRTAALESIGFTARVQGILQPLLGTSEAIREYERELREAGGTTRDVAEKQMESLRNQLGQLQKRFENWSMEVVQGVIPVIQSLIDNIDTLIAVVKVLIGVLGAAGLVKVLQLVAARLAVTAAAVLSMSQALGFAATAGAALQVVAGGLAALFTPGAALLVGLGALVAVLIKGQKEIDEINAKFTDMEGQVEKVGESLRKLQGFQLIATIQGEQTKLEQLRARAAEIRAELETAPTGGLGVRAGVLQAELSRVTAEIDRQKMIVEETQGAYQELWLEVVKTSNAAENVPPPGGDGGGFMADLEGIADRIGIINNALEAGLFERGFRGAALDQQLSVLSEMDRTAGMLAARIEAGTLSFEQQAAAQETLNELNRVRAGIHEDIFGIQKRTVDVAQRMPSLVEDQLRNLGLSEEAIADMRRRWTEASEEAEKHKGVVEDIEKEISQAVIQAIRNMQDAFSDAFNTILTDGIGGFRDMADAVGDVFRSLASEIAGILAAEALGIEDLIADIEEGGLGTLLKGNSLTGQIAGGLAGFAGGQSQGALGGAFSGALTGFLSGGGPIGALVGGLGGVLGGILGGGPSKDDLIQQERNRILEENNKRVQELSLALRERARTASRTLELGNIATALADALQSGELDRVLKSGATAESKLIDFLEGLGTSIEELERLAEEAGVTIRDSAGQLIPGALDQLQEAAAALAAQIAENERRFMQDLELRALEAQGLDEQAAALQNRLEVERALREAERQGFSEAAKERLLEVLALEQAAEAIERANAAREEERRIAQQRASLFADFESRRLALEGETQAAQIAQIEERARKEIESLKELQRAGTITREEMQRFIAIVRGETVQAIEDLIAREEELAEERERAKEAAEEAARAEEFRRMVEMENLRVRLLVAQGREQEAEALRDQIELMQAVEKGRSAEFLALLRQIQAAERAKREQQRLAQAQRAVADEAERTTKAINGPAGLRLSLLRFRAGLVGEPGGPTFEQATGFARGPGGSLDRSPEARAREAGSTTTIQRIDNRFGDVIIQASPTGDSPEELVRKLREGLTRVTQAGGVNIDVLPTV